jgi:hypothetical protein
MLSSVAMVLLTDVKTVLRREARNEVSTTVKATLMWESPFAFSPKNQNLIQSSL